MAQTEHWPRHQAVEASALATSSSTCMKISGGASAPPRLCGSSTRYSPFSINAETTGPVSRRVRSISSASRTISGASACARSIRPKPGSLFIRFLALFGFFGRRRRNGDLSGVADQDGGGDMAAPHFQLSQSETASIQSLIISSSGCCAMIAASRRISAKICGSRRSRPLFHESEVRLTRRPCFFPASGRQDLAGGQDFDTENVSCGIDIANEGPGLFGPVELAVPDGDIHRVGFRIVSYFGHGFRLAFRSALYIAPSFRGESETSE